MFIKTELHVNFFTKQCNIFCAAINAILTRLSSSENSRRTYLSTEGVYLDTGDPDCTTILNEGWVERSVLFTKSKFCYRVFH